MTGQSPRSVQFAGAAGGQGPEEHAVAVGGVHPDAIIQESAAAAAPGRVHGENRDAQLVLLVDAEPADQLIRQQRLREPPVPVMPRTGMPRSAFAAVISS